ncbi:23S rRNA (guanosine-2'-O-)-methyltransferase RlmB [compost metagenome]
MAWVVGNEGAGVSDGWMAHVTRKVGIPQPGGLESLNVAAATAICLFEAVRQRRAA